MGTIPDRLSRLNLRKSFFHLGSQRFRLEDARTKVRGDADLSDGCPFVQLRMFFGRHANRNAGAFVFLLRVTARFAYWSAEDFTDLTLIGDQRSSGLLGHPTAARRAESLLVADRGYVIRQRAVVPSIAL